jgi:hypothetical protein
VKDFPVINKGQEHSRELQDLFMRVVKTYAAIKELPTVAAINYDAEAPSRSKILTVNGIHFIADVERVTERALKNAPLLQVGWFALAKDKPISPTIARQVSHLYFADEPVAIGDVRALLETDKAVRATIRHCDQTGNGTWEARERL